MESILVLNPTTETIKGETSMAPRLTTLDGKILGIVNNSKRNSDVFLEFLVNRIKETYQLKDVLWINKRNPSLPMTDHVLEQLKLTHAVITGVGD
jgi:hypothetical protein